MGKNERTVFSLVRLRPKGKGQLAKNLDITQNALGRGFE
jgi:hypothetical protein